MSILVTDITWTRTYLEVDYECDEGDELELYRVAEQKFVAFQNERTADGAGREKVHAVVNVVIAGNREPLDAGDWILCTRFSEELLANEGALFEQNPYLHVRARAHVMKHMNPWESKEDEDLVERRTFEQRFDIIARNPYNTHDIVYKDEVLEKLGSLAQVFRYGGGQFVYTASLIPRSDSVDYPYVVLSLGFYKRNKKPRITKRSVRFKDVIRTWEKRAFTGIGSLFAAFSAKTDKRVLFLKVNGSRPTPNMAAVRDRMIERGLDKEFDIVERYRNIFGQPLQNPFSLLKDVWQITHSDYIFIDDYCPIFNFIKLRKGTVLTQIWHAGVGFKSVGYARFGIGGSPHPYNSVHRAYTYALVGNEHLRQVYSEVFGIEEEALLATGMPRLDHFLEPGAEEAAKNRLEARYPWMREGKVVLFAPTFRGAGQRSAYYPYETFIDMEGIYKACEKANCYFVFKMHPFIQEAPEIPEAFNGRIFDLSKEDITELYYASDVLVTDYSSCFYDYLLLKKPVIFYVPDKVVYSVTRGVQRTVDEMAPGLVCETFDDFMHAIESGDYSSVEPHPSCLDRKLEGGMLACDRVIDTVLLGKDVPGVRVPAEK